MGSITPLSNVFFIDQGAAAGGDGSIAKPYNTILAAVAARPAGGTFLLTPYDYSAEVIPTLNDADWAFWGLQLGSWPEGYGPGWTLTPPQPTSLTKLPSLTLGLGGTQRQTSLRSVSMPNLTLEMGTTLMLQDVWLDGLFTGASLDAGAVALRADRCFFNGGGVGGASLGDSQFNDCGFFGSQTIQTGSTTLQLTRCFGETSVAFLNAAGVLAIDLWSNGRVSVPVLTNGTKEVQGPVQNLTASMSDQQAQIDQICAAGVALGLWTDNRTP